MKLSLSNVLWVLGTCMGLAVIGNPFLVIAPVLLVFMAACYAGSQYIDSKRSAMNSFRI